MESKKIYYVLFGIIFITGVIILLVAASKQLELVSLTMEEIMKLTQLEQLELREMPKEVANLNIAGIVLTAMSALGFFIIYGISFVQNDY